MLPLDRICEGDIVTSAFGESIEPGSVYSLAEKAIFGSENSHVQAVNTLRRLQVTNTRDERVFKSVDDTILGDNVNQLHIPTEYLNRLTPSGMPPHKLH
uniref:ATP-dependent DNA helicase n=1 Tax=Heligmosomoides polygyrus TaxID=6339 RepID=A0A183GHH0_HELPZ